nr:serine/threonine protein kinase [uncultured bacterium]
MASHKDTPDVAASLRGAELSRGLAGFALARGPLAAAATVQRQSAIRSKARGKDDPAAEARLAAYQARLAMVDLAVARVAGLRPEIKDGQGLVFGRVLRGAAGVAGLTITGFDRAGEPLGAARTLAGGTWSFSVSRPASLCLVVSDDEKAVHTVRRQRVDVAPGQRHYIEIGLDGTAPRPAPGPTPDKPDPEPDPDPDPGPGPGPGDRPDVDVPGIVGLKEVEGLRAIREARLVPGSRKAGDFGIEPGTIARQSPEEGKSVPVGTRVDFAVSVRVEEPPDRRGPVPDLIGRSPAEAAKALREAGLSLGELTVVRGQVDTPIIGKQEPEAGTERASGRGVDLAVRVARPATADIATVLAIASLQPGFPADADTDALAEKLTASGAKDVATARALVGGEPAKFAEAAGIADPARAATLRKALAATLPAFGGQQ